MTAAPVKPAGSPLSEPDLSDEWWDTLNTSLDNLARQHTTRVATPDTEPASQSVSQALVTAVINRAVSIEVDATITDHGWVPAHADLQWSNLTAPQCWILD